MNLPHTPEIIRGAKLGLPTARDLPSEDSDTNFTALDHMPRAEDLPHDDGEPMETPWHRDEMNLLIECLHVHWCDRTDYFVGGNMFLYFSNEQVFNRDFRGPDFFVVKGVDGMRTRLAWVTWDEGGRLPDVIIELVSATTAKIDRVVKKKLYAETFRTAEYFCYDPETDRLEGWRLHNGNEYIPIGEEPGGRMLSQQLELYLGRWDGKLLDQHHKRYLRFYTPVGQLVPTARERESAGREAEAKRAEAEAKRAEVEAKRAEAAEIELARVKHELEALRQHLPPATP